MTVSSAVVALIISNVVDTRSHTNVSAMHWIFERTRDVFNSRGKARFTVVLFRACTGSAVAIAGFTD